jgi:NADH-quinone oxidoreductase subunit N
LIPLPTSVIALLPEYVLTLTGVLIVLIEAVLKPTASRKPLGWLAIAGATATGLISWYQLRLGALTAFSGSIQVDAFSIFFHLLIGAVVVVTLLGSLDYFDGHASHAGEYFALVLFGAVGMMLMTCSVDLLMVFIGLEISSISTYILAGFRKGEGASVEASIKYFLLGSFATAFFLYGIALAYGATGSTGIAAIAAGLGASATPRMAFLALAMMLVGLGFKVSAAPFHLWTPDVYQGAPAPVVGLMSTAPKAAAFAVLLRITFCGFPLMQQRWAMLLWGLAALSMTIGNLGALRQTNVKRMLAYSSIAHAGYLLAAFTAFAPTGISAACFYTAAYAAMNVGAFAVVTQIGGYKETLRSFKDYQGLALRRPVLAALLALFLLSLIGIPFTGGFFGKFYVFAAVLQAGHVWLAVIGLINSGVACFYYLRLLSSVYTRPVATFSAPGQTTPSLAPTPAISVPAGIGLTLTAAATLLLGILPGHILHLANSAGSGLRATSSIASPTASPANSLPSLPSSGQPR